jgi:hypothetical protein
MTCIAAGPHTATRPRPSSPPLPLPPPPLSSYNFWLMCVRSWINKLRRKKNARVKDYFACGKVRAPHPAAGRRRPLPGASGGRGSVAQGRPHAPRAPLPEQAGLPRSPPVCKLRVEAFRGRRPPPSPPAHPQLGRSIFSETCASDPKDAILAVQQARNAMTASTYLATVSSLLATAGGAGPEGAGPEGAGPEGAGTVTRPRQPQSRTRGGARGAAAGPARQADPHPLPPRRAAPGQASPSCWTPRRPTKFRSWRCGGRPARDGGTRNEDGTGAGQDGIGRNGLGQGCGGSRRVAAGGGC